MSRFDAARRAALINDLLAVLTNKPSNLLPFDDVRERLRLRNLIDRGIQEVSVDKIVGTIGRERDFNRAFLPREESLRSRWIGVENLAEGPAGFPSVELYRVGDAYFVVDGHHRISVMRALGTPTIEANVKEFLTNVAVDPGDSIESMVIKGNLAAFLDATGLGEAGGGEFSLTDPNGYERLLEHINGHMYFRGIEENRQVPWREAVQSWLMNVYRPMVTTIRRSGILDEFPGSTEGDVYLYIMDHLHHLRQQYAPRQVSPQHAVRAVKVQRLRTRKSKSLLSLFARWRDRLGKIVSNKFRADQ